MGTTSIEIYSPVTEELFIGREKYIKSIVSSLLVNYASFSVYGEKNIGKTALVKEVQRRILESDKNVNFIWENVSKYNSIENGYYKLIKSILNKVVEKLKEEKVEDEFFFEDLEELEEDSIPDVQELLRDGVQLAKENGIKLVLVLDDFDAAINVYEGKSGRYQYLRSLKGPVNALPAIIISCKPITEIEVPYDGGSLLALTLAPIRISEFSENDMNLYYDKMSKQGIRFSENEKEQIEKITEKKPHLLNLLGNELSKKFLDQSVQNISCVISSFCKKKDKFDDVL